jgi:hypothetical protein
LIDLCERVKKYKKYMIEERKKDELKLVTMDINFMKNILNNFILK